MKNALISVYEKDGLNEFAAELINRNFDIYSTGGTFKYLKDNGIKVKSIESLTSFPEVLDGRVKTLHPTVFSGILAKKNNKKHLEELVKHNLILFDLVYVNLYPFYDTILTAGTDIDDAIEQIDIGGVSLIRAAAKNYKFVNVITWRGQFQDYFSEFDKSKGKISEKYSMRLAYEAFDLINGYDFHIKNYFESLIEKNMSESERKKYFVKSVEDVEIDLRNKLRGDILRYGENPHQTAHFLKLDFDKIYEVIHGKELSYNNLLDIDAAHSLIYEFKNDSPTTAIVKHGNPCGVATKNNLKESYIKAFECDTVSPFGGIIVFNKKLDLKTAQECDKIFSEIILAPDFDDDVLDLLKKKKNRRLLKFKFKRNASENRSITGGILDQEVNMSLIDKNKLKTVTKKKPTKKELIDLEFANKIVKHTKSNAVVFIKNLQTLGIGGGQPSRIDSTKIAITKAKQFKMNLENSVAASDAFFPFPDGLIAIAKAGAKCVIQPGGSVRDDEVIKAADKKGIAMMMTGIRHFRH